jgi:hypothetical protein
MAPSLTVFETARINGIYQGLQDVRDLPRNLTWSARIPLVPATDAEIEAQMIADVFMADLVADDQKAGVYSTGRFQFLHNAIPNLKIGAKLSQRILNQLANIGANAGLMNDGGVFKNYENWTLNNILTGIRLRREALSVAMAIDAYSYDRLGIRITGASWGMPADLKVTVLYGWDDPVNATPVTDVLTVKRAAQVQRGKVYNRISMSMAAFIYMVGTAEFQSKARFILPPGTPASILPLQGTAYMRTLAQSVLEVDELELYDTRGKVQNEDGSITSQPLLPITKVVLSNTADDNDPLAWDFANSYVTESIVASLVPSESLGFGGPVRGPVAYPTINEDFNPPDVTYWGVQRGWPRKHDLTATAVLTVGSFSDPISTVPPQF